MDKNNDEFKRSTDASDLHSGDYLQRQFPLKVPAASLLPRLTVAGFLAMLGSMALPSHPYAGAMLGVLIGLVAHFCSFSIRYFATGTGGSTPK